MKTRLITFVSFLAIPRIAVGSADRIANQDVEFTKYGVVFTPEPTIQALVPWNFIKSITYDTGADVPAKAGK